MWFYVLNAAIDFVASMAAFAVWTHFDLEGWWEQYRIEKGRKLDARIEPPSKQPKTQRREW